MTAASIASYRCRLSLEVPVDTPDGMGGTVQSFSALAALWGRIEPARGSERAEAQRPEGVVSHRITLRFRTDITTAMRLTSGTRSFNILGSYDPDGRRRTLVCLVEEVQP